MRDIGQIAYHTTPGPVTEVQTGDFLLHHASAFHSRLIRIGEAFRAHGKDKTYAYWNHASICVEPGVLVEALGSGVVRSPVAKYADSVFARVRVGWTPDDLAEALAYVHDQEGDEYGYFTLVGVALHALTGGKLMVGIDETVICSGLTAGFLVRGKTRFERHDPSNIMPFDLARHFNVPAPGGKP